MDTAPVHHKRKVEPLVKPPNPIDITKDLNQGKDPQQSPKGKEKKPKRPYVLQNPAESGVDYYA